MHLFFVLFFLSLFNVNDLEKERTQLSWILYLCLYIGLNALFRAARSEQCSISASTPTIAEAAQHIQHPSPQTQPELRYTHTLM